MGKSVVVVEERESFGGHTSTYIVPGTNAPINFGVQVYAGDEPSIRRFFGYYNIPLIQVQPSSAPQSNTRHVDFKTGTEAVNFTVNPDLSAFSVEAHKYADLSFQTRAPSPLPADLLLPFRDFVTKYNLQSSVYKLFFQGEGLGDLLSQPTYYVFKNFSPDLLDSFLPTSPGVFIVPTGSNQEIYQRAQADFGDDAIVDSRILVASQRSDSGVTVTIKTPTGLQTIQASKLLISAPPTLENMAPLLLDSHEIPLFSSFKSQGYFVGLVNVTGFAPGDEFYNMAPGATYALPQLPALYQISPTAVAGIYQVNYGSQEDYYPEMLVKADIVATVERVRRSVLGAAVARGLPPVKLLAFSSHAPFSLRVSAGEISSGFYTKLDGLQGYRSTWYTGAAFSGHHASHVWKFTEDIVNRMFA
ncbi:FAD dependent oxidoreductase family protein [Podospora appendiculata]|uniref:FAD dependent oxidoreductase family protein n=1 Tax=Podospora appendiculata TaxID=314037 RepID=A0AAE0X0N0_9PEZI|nr:FAD dependent oxidoreductase family protein [Podospora appendiculata]